MSKAPVFILSILLCVIGLGVTSTAMAGTSGVCSAEAAERTDAFISQSNVSWEGLSQHWRTTKACDDGYFAEGYSEMVVHLFAYEWSKFPEFVRFARMRSEFYSWVIKHIDESTSPDDLAKVVSNARSCRTDEQSAGFCNDVAHAAEQALKRTNWK